MAISLTPTQRAHAAWAGVRIEQVTVAWMVIEAVVSIAAGLLAHSLLLTAFGIDSVIELISGGILLWRLLVQAHNGSLERIELAERRAAWVVFLALSALCVYIVASAAFGVLTQARPDSSIAGMLVAAAAVISMPILARRKRAIATQIGSAALRGDAACSLTCAYMAGTLFVGLALNALFGWWWADSVTALAFLWFVIPEAREALAGARAGKAACSCGDETCVE